LATLPNVVNSDLSKGFTVSQVAEKHGWTEPMVWSLALEVKEDSERFKEIAWGLRTWDHWEWNDCDRRFGNDCRDFQNTPFSEERITGSILFEDYIDMLSTAG